MLPAQPRFSHIPKQSSLLIILLLALSCRVSASPSHYRQFWSDAVVGHWAAAQAQRSGGGAGLQTRSNRYERQYVNSNNNSIDCGTPIADQPMYFTQFGCAIASQNMTYADTSGDTPVLRTVSKGDFVKLRCDDVFCPIPARPDCYENPGICGSDEWCMVDIHEKWGRWAMNADGTTPQSEYCFEAAAIAANSTDKAFLASYQQMCVDSTLGDFGLSMGPKIETWKPARGTCVKYRTAQQSCIGNPLEFGAFENEFGLSFKRQEDGKPFARPLVCGPGLVCTGPDYEVSPSTCLPQRPKDICYSGPWWDSTECPRTASNTSKGGLNQTLAIAALHRFILLFPGEVASPGDCAFWNRNTSLGAQVYDTQKKSYNIAAALWPTHLIGAIPSFNDVVKAAGDPNSLGSTQDCTKQAEISGSNIALALARAGTLSAQPNQVWSMIHFLAHNQQNPLSAKQVAAFRALAGHLSENFWCDDCRGFFTVGIVGRYGLPPQSTNPEEHAQYWWYGHNVASEHTSSSRAGHPWIHQFGMDEAAKFQNPYFMSWKDAVEQWTYQQ